jgi:thioredoxin-dependent peroxiredoxin
VITVSTQAPNFTLPDQNNEIHSLSEAKGKWVFLYFYPKDDTSGCTEEACDLRDNYEQIAQMGVEVFGVSPDSVQSHKKFEQKNSLNFHLLADTEKKVVQDYEVWKEKSMYGKKYMGVERTSFIINPEGTVVKVYEKVNPTGHVTQVIKDLTALLNKTLD